MIPTVYSLQSMHCSGSTADDVSTPSSLEPLPAHLTSTQKAPPGVVPSPLDASFLRHDNAEWEPNNFIVTFFSDADSTVSMKVNFFDFVKETPETYLQQVIKQDTRLYLPPDLFPSGKEANPKGGKDICVTTNLPAFLNNDSCFDEGYTLVSNGSKGRGSLKENVAAIYSYRLVCK